MRRADLAVLERAHGHHDGKKRFARTGRADAEGERVAFDRLRPTRAVRRSWAGSLSRAACESSVPGNARPSSGAPRIGERQRYVVGRDVRTATAASSMRRTACSARSTFAVEPASVAGRRRRERSRADVLRAPRDSDRTVRRDERDLRDRLDRRFAVTLRLQIVCVLKLLRWPQRPRRRRWPARVSRLPPNIPRIGAVLIPARANAASNRADGARAALGREPAAPPAPQAAVPAHRPAASRMRRSDGAGTAAPAREPAAAVAAASRDRGAAGALRPALAGRVFAMLEITPNADDDQPDDRGRGCASRLISAVAAAAGCVGSPRRLRRCSPMESRISVSALMFFMR